MRVPVVRVAVLALALALFAAPGAAQDAAAGGEVRVYGDVFAEYVNERLEDGPNGDSFELSRALAGAEARFGLAVGALEVESVRSAAPASGFGIDGNALVLRVRRATAGVEHTWGGRWRLSGHAGVVRHGWIDSIETGYRLRGLGQMASEASGLVDAGDVGAMLEGGLFGERLVLGVQVVNGEGRSDVERNDGKNIIGYARGRALALDVHRGPLSLDLHLFGQDGSVGAGSARSHRLGAGVTFVAPCPSAGVVFVRAWGAYDDGSRNASSISAWAESRLATRWIGVAIRMQRIVFDADVDDATRTTTTAGLFSDVVDVGTERTGGHVRLYAGYEIERAGAFGSDVSGVDGLGNASRVRVVLELRGSVMRDLGAES